MGGGDRETQGPEGMEVETRRKESERDARETETEMATARQAQRHRVESRERIRARMRQTSSKGCKERLGGRERQPNAATFLGDTGVIPPGGR